MRTIYYYLLIALIAIPFTGCNKVEEPSGGNDRPVYSYTFAISIKDAAGNDLVAPLQGTNADNIDVKPEGYTLEIIPSNPRPDIDTHIIAEPWFPRFGVRHIEGSVNWYLINFYNCFREFGPQEYITYRISSTIIFGDNKEHDIVAYWGEDPFYPSPSQYVNLLPECMKVVFDGKEIDVKKVAVTFPTLPNGEVPYRPVFYYLVDIVLDK